MTIDCTIRPIDTIAPHEFEMLIDDIGSGENGFEANILTRRDISTSEKFKACQEMADPTCLKPGRVPQTIYWILNEHKCAIGIIKIRHYLNDQLLTKSGHIGFYIRRDVRGKGYGKQALKLALEKLKRLNEPRALITVNTDNIASNAIIRSCGGKLEDTRIDPQGQEYHRYWIELL